MAKPLPVAGIEPERRVRPNARRILAVRIAEVWGYAPHVEDPANVRELHDMRIAFKRLRYLIEIFGVAFASDLGPYLEEVKAMQDLLGEIHDRDVQVPMLEDHLRWLEEREAEAAIRLLGQGPGRRTPKGGDSEAAYRAFRQRFVAGRRPDERPGIHTLIARRRAERIELYERFRAQWARLREERFREELEAAVGIRRD